MVEAALHHRVGGRFAVFVQEVLFQRTRVHADADRTVVITGGFDHFFDPRFIPDVTRIDAQAGRAREGGFDAAFVVEMDVSHDRHGAFAANLFHRGRGCLVRHRNAHDVSACFGCADDLVQRGLYVMGQGIRHGLHRDRRVPTHGHIANHDLARFTTVDIAPRTDRVVRHGTPLK